MAEPAAPPVRRIVIGRLTALQTERADDAARRAGKSRALFRISRTLATATSIADALPVIAEELVAETRMDRVWIATRRRGAKSSSPTREAVPDRPARIHVVLTRTPGDQPARLGPEPSPRRIAGRMTSRIPTPGSIRTTISVGESSSARSRPTRRRRRSCSGSGGDAAPESCRRSARPCVPARAPRGSGQRGGGRPPGRAAQGRAPGLGLARVPHAAREHPGRRRSLLDPEVALVRRAASRRRPDDRYGGRTTEPARPQPPRHEPDRGRRLSVRVSRRSTWRAS